jgi:hypothetical protein
MDRESARGLLGHAVPVIVREGGEAEGKMIAPDAGSLVVSHDRSGSPLAVPLDRVTLVQQPVGVRPAIGGCFAGALTGGSIGALLGCISAASLLGLATSVTGYQMVRDSSSSAVPPANPNRISMACTRTRR